MLQSDTFQRIELKMFKTKSGLLNRYDLLNAAIFFQSSLHKLVFEWNEKVPEGDYR